MVSQLESLTSRYPVPTASDGQGTPSTIASCVGQAAGAGAAGIILDAIPSGMAQNALGGAKAKGVPVIVADQYPPSGTANSNQVAYVPGIVDQPSQIAWWLIASSGGKANAIVAEETDSPSSRAYVQNSLAIFKKYCPGCTIQVKQITATQNHPAAAGRGELRYPGRPGVQYYYPSSRTASSPRCPASSSPVSLPASASPSRAAR
jgi:ribose transport system substrate-binding protein